MHAKPRSNTNCPLFGISHKIEVDTWLIWLVSTLWYNTYEPGIGIPPLRVKCVPTIRGKEMSVEV
jgi:hypothetical protein